MDINNSVADQRTLRDLYSEALKLAGWAVEADNWGDVHVAVLYYTELSQLLMHISNRTCPLQMADRIQVSIYALH